MDENKKSSRLLKNNLETIILRSLFDGKKHGYEIVREIEEKTEGEIAVNKNTLYTALKRLESNGLIQSSWGEESRGGRRKYFNLTAQGLQLCQKQQSEWEYSRHLLDKLVSNKQFDGDAVIPEIDIVIDKKQRIPRVPKPKQRRFEVLEAIEDIAQDLTDIPAHEEMETPAEQSEQIPDTSFIEDEYEGFELSQQEQDDFDVADYYREVDRNIDALMEDDDVIDDTINSTGNLLDSLQNTQRPEPPVYERPVIGHVNRDYLFNFYKKEPQKSTPTPPPSPVFNFETADKSTEEYKSFAAAQKNSEPVDIFEEEENQEEEPVQSFVKIEPTPPPQSVQTAEESPYNYNKLDSFHQEVEESESEREYKKIISNLLYKKPEPVAEDLPELTSPQKPQTNTADKILSSVGAASFTYKLDAYESTGDMPSGGLGYAQNTSPLGYDMLSDLKERLAHEGIKLRQYEQAPKTSSERYDFYYKNKLLFAALWIVYGLALVELGLIYLLFGSMEGVSITWQRLLVYSLVMLLFPLIGTAINYSRNNVKVRAEWDFAFRLRDSLIVFILGFFVIVAVDLIVFQLAFAKTNDVIVLLVMPSVMLFNVVLGIFVYNILYRSKRYFVK